MAMTTTATVQWHDLLLMPPMLLDCPAELVLPPSEVALYCQLMSNRRNCWEIQQFCRHIIENHHAEDYMSLAR